MRSSPRWQAGVGQSGAGRQHTHTTFTSTTPSDQQHLWRGSSSLLLDSWPHSTTATTKWLSTCAQARRRCCFLTTPKLEPLLCKIPTIKILRSSNRLNTQIRGPKKKEIATVVTKKEVFKMRSFQNDFFLREPSVRGGIISLIFLFLASWFLFSQLSRAQCLQKISTKRFE